MGNSGRFIAGLLTGLAHILYDDRVDVQTVSETSQCVRYKLVCSKNYGQNEKLAEGCFKDSRTTLSAKLVQKILYYHFVCDPDLKVIAVGSGFLSVAGKNLINTNISEFLEIVKPEGVAFDFSSITNRLHVPYVLSMVKLNATSGVSVFLLHMVSSKALLFWYRPYAMSGD